jgi:hypothetical protein
LRANPFTYSKDIKEKKQMMLLFFAFFRFLSNTCMFSSSLIFSYNLNSYSVHPRDTPRFILDISKVKIKMPFRNQWRDVKCLHDDGILIDTTSNETAKLFDATLTQYVGW